MDVILIMGWNGFLQPSDLFRPRSQSYYDVYISSLVKDKRDNGSKKISNSPISVNRLRHA